MTSLVELISSSHTFMSDFTSVATVRKANKTGWQLFVRKYPRGAGEYLFARFSFIHTLLGSEREPSCENAKTSPFLHTTSIRRLIRLYSYRNVDSTRTTRKTVLARRPPKSSRPAALLGSHVASDENLNLRLAEAQRVSPQQYYSSETRKNSRALRRCHARVNIKRKLD